MHKCPTQVIFSVAIFSRSKSVLWEYITCTRVYINVQVFNCSLSVRSGNSRNGYDGFNDDEQRVSIKC